MKNYRLSLEGERLVVTVKDRGGCIESGLQRRAEDDGAEYNAFLDALESIVLAHACAGIDIEDQRYVEGIVTSLQAAANQLE